MREARAIDAVSEPQSDDLVPRTGNAVPPSVQRPPVESAADAAAAEPFLELVVSSPLRRALETTQVREYLDLYTPFSGFIQTVKYTASPPPPILGACKSETE